MNKSIYAIALMCVLGTTYANAGNGNGPSGGDGSCTGNCPQGQGGGTTNQENSQAQQQAQAQGQAQSQELNNENTASSTSNSESTASSRSNSSSNSNSGGNTMGQSVGVSVRGPDVSTKATGGTASAAGGNSANTIRIEGDDYDVAASSAASVFAGECQTGMSGQVEAGGFAVVNPDQFCQSVKAARVALQAYEWELDNGATECTAIEYGYTTPEGQDTIVESLQELCINEKAEEYLAEYRHHTDEAIGLVRSTETVGFVDTISGYLVRPVALIAVLILLI